jgi:hypothetical protein
VSSAADPRTIETARTATRCPIVRRNPHVNDMTTPYLKLLLSLPLLLVASCAPGVNVPRPNAEPSKPVPAAEPSTIRVPVTIDLSATLAQAESVVPKQFKASGDWIVVDRNPVGDFGIKFEAARDPLKIELNGGRLSASSRVRYWIEAAQRVPKPIVGGSFWQTVGTCGRGEALREVQVGLDAQIGIVNGWQLTSKTTVSRPTFTNQCRMTFLKVNVTDRVADAFTQALARAASTVDQQIARQGNLRAFAEKAWAQLQTPIALDSGFSLALAPTGAGLLGLEGSGRSVTAVLGITARPVVALGAAPGKRTSLTALSDTRLPEGFHVSVDGELSFEEINRQLRQRLVGTTQAINGHTITFTGAEAYGSGERIVMRLDLEGDITGTVYFVGTPKYDPQSSVLSLADIDYSLETREALLNVADWLYHEGFRSSIAQQARFGLERGVSQVRARLEKALNRELAPGVRSMASIGAIRPVGVFVTPGGLLARVAVDGTMRLEIR